MKKIFTISIVISIILTIMLHAGMIVYAKFHPPLSSFGWGHYKINNKVGIVVDISNEGLFNVKIVEVLVNDNKKPELVQLGTSRTEELVTFPGRGNEISFYDISEYPVRPALSPDKRQQLLEQGTEK